MVRFIGKILLLFLLTYFSYQLIFTSPPWIFIDGANLLIHEAGHMAFLPFGRFAHFIGGSVLQLFVPCIFFLYFLIRKEYFSVSVMLFWIGNNVINISVYMKDAKRMLLPLLGGDTSIHDWNWIFSQLGILSVSDIIGTAFFYFGVMLLLTSLLGMLLFILYGGDDTFSI